MRRNDHHIIAPGAGRLHIDDICHGRGVLLSKADDPVKMTGDLDGKSVAVLKNTTTMNALKEYLRESLIDAKIVEVGQRRRRHGATDVRQGSSSGKGPGCPDRPGSENRRSKTICIVRGFIFL